MTKQEQINKIAGELLAYQPLIDIPFEQFYKVARAIVDLEYRKVDKDSVILTKEEYIDLSRTYIGEQIAQARKKTAKEILTYLWKQRNVIGQLMIFEEDLIELAKQYSVEVEE